MFQGKAGLVIADYEVYYMKYDPKWYFPYYIKKQSDLRYSNIIDPIDDTECGKYKW